MIAANKEREMAGQSLSYNESDFMDIIEEYGIHHNKFPGGD